jgi:hypothetical protein
MLFPNLTANDLAVIARTMFVILVVPTVLSSAGLTVLAFVYPFGNHDGHEDSEFCPPSVRMPPAKPGIKNHVADPSASVSNGPQFLQTPNAIL